MMEISMKRLLLGLALLMSFAVSADPNPFAGGSDGQYDGIWVMDTGQYISFHTNSGRLIGIQLDDNLVEGQGRKWMVYSGESAAGNATLASHPDFSDFHAVIDIHFLSETDFVGYFSNCVDSTSDCEHSPVSEVHGNRVW